MPAQIEVASGPKDHGAPASEGGSSSGLRRGGGWIQGPATELGSWTRISRSPRPTSGVYVSVTALTRGNTAKSDVSELQAASLEAFWRLEESIEEIPE